MDGVHLNYKGKMKLAHKQLLLIMPNGQLNLQQVTSVKDNHTIWCLTAQTIQQRTLALN